MEGNEGGKLSKKRGIALESWSKGKMQGKGKWRKKEIIKRNVSLMGRGVVWKGGGDTLTSTRITWKTPKRKKKKKKTLAYIGEKSKTEWGLTLLKKGLSQVEPLKKEKNPRGDGEKKI